jgi:hypothetical protein
MKKTTLFFSDASINFISIFERFLSDLPRPFRSGPEGPPDGNSMPGAEVMARKTHNADIAFFRENTVSFHFDKNSHGA